MTPFELAHKLATTELSLAEVLYEALQAETEVRHPDSYNRMAVAVLERFEVTPR